MKTIFLIRHGMTQGNSLKRYIGRTDEPLCPDGVAQANALRRELPLCDFVFSSPMLRCRQTAETLFPGREICIINDLAECDFGRFENRTADELADDPEYVQWVDAGCSQTIPGGEDVLAFKARSTGAYYREVCALPKNSTAAFVIHGGNIMAILERYEQPKRPFYEYHLGNCEYHTLKIFS
jgi:alpha-ribazole phosphatase